MKTAVSRLLAVAAVIMLVGMLPWLSGRSPEYTILRARYAELEATPENLAMIRAQVGLDQGALPVFFRWFGGLLHGDFGSSWVTNTPVLPGTLEALGVSLTLMSFAITVSLILAAALCLPAIVRGARGRPGRGSGVVAASLTAVPEFLLAALLLVTGAIWLGLFPPYGWEGVHYAVLPALALGLPGGGLIGRLLSDSISSAFSEKWVGSWRLAGFSTGQIVLAVLRRALPSVLSQIGLVLVGTTGGAVAVEKVFAIPGIGRATLGAAAAQDIPALQAGILMLLGLAAAIGCLTALGRLLILGPPARSGNVPVATVAQASRPRDFLVPAVAAGVLLLIVVAGLFRDPFAANSSRLAPPSWALPFGADASGRDLLARVGHGAITTLGTAFAVVLACLVIGLIIGLFPLAASGPLEVTNAAPPVLAGIVVAAIAGPSNHGAAVAVALVCWAPLAAHTSALTMEARTLPYVSVLPVLGVGKARILWRHILPSVAGPVFRHAMLRLPGIALALAALGFLGLGSSQPTPEWGLILAEGIGYVERAPWTVWAPAGTLMLSSVLAVSLSSISWSGGGTLRRTPPAVVSAAATEPATVSV